MAESESVDSFVLVRSFLPNGGPIFSMAVYPSEFGIQRMKEAEIYGPVGLFDDEDDRNEDHLDEKQETLGEILNGDRLVTAPYEVKFLQGKDQEVACAKKLTSEEVSQIQAAIKQFYIFQMYCDDLPIWGYKGKVEESSTNISKHKYRSLPAFRN
ncbi:transmembrane 9 superfamily member 4 [Eucalyptus grandis]|uniref:transmembrane 9 superfamily member 4 n=1 Tax=Eucalyptus grandis TaxID=71139 RepID=UPI00192F07D6|nr:transmembrane 9 superfamily member 4 [Eucalyptus grandis]XP_039173988.1 transmembrane 9 superfamily member 4 [Eucalyptus grandis]